MHARVGRTLLLFAIAIAFVGIAVGCGGDDAAVKPRPSQKTIYIGEGLSGRPVDQDCQWDASVEVEEDTVLQVLSQTRGARVVQPGDVVRDDMWPPPPEREGDKDYRGIEKRGPNGGRLFYGLGVHWTEEGVLRSGCRHPPSPTPA